jgi:hypothetical protein
MEEGCIANKRDCTYTTHESEGDASTDGYAWGRQRREGAESWSE